MYSKFGAIYTNVLNLIAQYIYMNTIKTILFLFFVLHASSGILYSQDSKKNEGNIIAFNFSLGGDLPGGDLKDRFGYSNYFGLGGDYILDGSDMVLGLNFNYNFGNIVHEDVFSNLRTSEGLVIGTNGEMASLFMRQRGYYLGVLGGKIFHLKDKSYRSGIRVTGGVGIMRHWVRLLDNTNSVPQIKGDYKAGYDRLTGGFALQENISYHIMSNNHRVNFILGFEFTQGFTSDMRDIYFNTGEMNPNGSRVDLRYALKLSWTLPFYIQQNPDELFY